MVWPEIVDITHAREIQNKDTQNDKTRGKSKKDKCILQVLKQTQKHKSVGEYLRYCFDLRLVI